MTQRELILYLTPAGQLAEQCDEFLRVSGARFGLNEDHAYPPHVTLTGFFHRDTNRCDAVRAEIDGALVTFGRIPADAVRNVGLHVVDSWVGLEIESTWAKQLTAHAVDAHRALGDEDRLRPKDWLHLSLAYGLNDSQNPNDSVTMAHELVDPEAAVAPDFTRSW